MREVSREFPGEGQQVAAVRRFVAEALGRVHPARCDAVLLASELATNAIKHTKSGTPGGTLRVTAAVDGHAVRVAVADQGAQTWPCACRFDPERTHGRGVPVLDALAARWGITREPGGTRVWFEIRA